MNGRDEPQLTQAEEEERDRWYAEKQDLEDEEIEMWRWFIRLKSVLR